MSKNEVCVLQSGYCTPCSDGKSSIADCSVTLIKSRDLGNVLVDTSGPWNKEKLISDLNKHNVSVGDISIVVCTHGHSDHVGNLNIFPPLCKMIVGYDISRGNVYDEFDFTAEPVYSLSRDVEVIATPGHTHSDVSVIVRNTELGTVCIAGDLFECHEDLSIEELWRDKSENPDLQKKNRQRMLKLADYIVPGHGEMFKVRK